MGILEDMRKSFDPAVSYALNSFSPEIGSCLLEDQEVNRHFWLLQYYNG